MVTGPFFNVAIAICCFDRNSSVAHKYTAAVNLALHENSPSARCQVKVAIVEIEKRIETSHHFYRIT